MLLQAGQSSLLVVDIQERLAPAIAGQAAVIGRAAAVIEGASRLGVPVLVSEQYPKGLGPTVEFTAIGCAFESTTNRTSPPGEIGRCFGSSCSGVTSTK